MVIESLLYWLSLSLKYYLASEFSFSESEATLNMQVVGCDDGTRTLPTRRPRATTTLQGTPLPPFASADP